MAIYRGPGGSGDAVNDSSSETRLAVEARDAALAAQAAAEAAQAAAETAETNAETAETNAETAETNAETAATSAASSASTATTKASEASTSATNAASSASAASTSATNAASSASAASTSESNASTSATNAASSASSASTSATSAASSASSASTSASTATTKASEASTSATNAASSASSASSSASTATTQAGLASTSATNAASSASAASTSASNAATSATNASNSASAAATSATNASNSASAANTSATNAASSASSSQAAADAALAALDSFDDRYLGQKSSAPTVDNDGNALVTGALYFDTVSNAMKVWDGSAWLSAYASLSGALLATNNLSDLSSASTARTNLGVAIGTNVQAWDADLDTWATKTAPTGDVVGTSDSQTLTNKTISGASNTLSNIGNSSLTNSSITIGGSAVSLGGTVGTLGVGYGGTGLTSLTAGYIPFGAGTSAFGSSSSLFWDNTNARLGVGTSSPSYRLDVYGASSDVARIYYPASGVQTSKLWFGTLSNTAQAYVAATTLSGSTGTLEFGTGATERMRIDSSGNVGIGTSSPLTTLTVAGAGSSQNDLTYQIQSYNSSALYNASPAAGWLARINYTSGGAAMNAGGIQVVKANTTDADTAAYMSFHTRASGGTVAEKMRLDSSGNLGLGVTPSAWATYTALQIKNGSIANYSPTQDMRISSNAYYNAGWKYTASAYATQYLLDGSVGIHAWYTAPSGTAGNAITFTQAMTLDASGNLLVGGTSAGGKFEVFGTLGNTRILSSGAELTFTRNDNNDIKTTGGSSAYITLTGNNGLLFSTGSTPSERMRIDSSGNVGIGTSSPTGYSGAKVLDIYGTGAAVGQLVVEGASGTNFLTAYSGTSSADTPAIYFNQGLRFGTASNKDATGFTERFRIASNGAWGLSGANYGTSGQALVSNGSGSAPSWQTVSSTGALKSVQTFTTSGTWTRPSGVTKIVVEVCGGGGGGYSVSSGAPNGTGGGAGGYCKKIIDVSSISSATVTIGSGGAVNTAGGNSSWSDGTNTLTANGGSAGGSGSASNSPTGGTATGGNINVQGGDGGEAKYSGYIDQKGGNGGASFFGGGGTGAQYEQRGALAGKAYGAGGGGGSVNGYPGAAGMSGIVIVWEYS